MGLGEYYEPSLRWVLLRQVFYILALVLSPGVLVIDILRAVFVIAIERRPPLEVLTTTYLVAFLVGEFAATSENVRVLIIKTLRLVYEIRKKRPPYGIATRRKEISVGNLWSILPNFEKTYRYWPLRGDHDIRLLHIYPGRFNDSLQGEIIEKNLLLSPNHAALSYTWADENGDASKTGTLELLENDQIIRITANCERAIRRLRLPNASRRVWIDAVCIDQSNSTERTHQVSLMSRIYMSATEVIAYTGEGTQQTDKLFDWLDNLGSEQLRAHSDSMIRGILGQAFTLTSPGDLSSFVRNLVLRIGENCRARWPSKEAVKRISQVEMLSDTEIIQLTREYFSRRWFNRVWVLQEVALPNARHITIMCGAKKISGERALYALSLLPNDGSTSMVQIFVAIRQRRMALRNSHLLDVLIETRDRQSADPRDKIFGVLSISQGLDEGRFPELSATYDLDTVQVYTKYSKFFIRQHGIAFFLSLTKPSPNRLPGLPSWSADWTVPWPNMNTVAPTHFAAASRQVSNNDDDVEFSRESEREILTIKRRRIVSGYITRDGHLDGSKTATVENVENLNKEHILIEIYPGVAALLQIGHEGSHIFVQTCPHASMVEEVPMLVGKWADVVVNGYNCVARTMGFEYLGDCDIYRIE